jgi:hypothetical protein
VMIVTRCPVKLSSQFPAIFSSMAFSSPVAAPTLLARRD